MLNSVWFRLVLYTLMPIAGMSAEYRFNRITIEQGLSHSKINVILQDGKGFMWFGTDGGLNRYDGKIFLIFRHHRNDSLSLSDNVVNTLIEADERHLIVGTQKGLCLLDRYTNQMQRVRLGDTHLEDNYPSISTIVPTDDHTFWIGTNGSGVFRYSVASRMAIGSEPESHGLSFLQGRHITAMFADDEGMLWIGTESDGLYLYDPRSGRLLHHLLQPSEVVFPSISRINSLMQEKPGVVWAGTESGLRVITATTGVVEKSYQVGTIPDAPGRSELSSTAILSMAKDEKGTIWLGTRDNGLVELDPGRAWPVFHRLQPSNPGSLLSNEIRTVVTDKSGTLWIGTGFGINLIDIQGERFTLHSRQPGALNTLSSDNVHAILKEPSGVLWIGTYDKGLNRYEPATALWTTYLEDDVLEAGESLVERTRLLRTYESRVSRATQSKITFLSHNRVLALHRDAQRNIWIGTGKGLNMLSAVTGQITRFSPDKAPGAPAGHVIRAISRTPDGTLWIGSEDAGLSRYANRSFIHYRHRQDDMSSLSHDHITCMLPDADGNLWIGTHGGGLNRMDPITEKFFRYGHSAKNSLSLSSDIVYCLHKDPQGRLWIGTADGLNLYDPDQKGFVRIGMEEGLPSNFIYAILSDNSNNLWISTNKGIVKYDPGRNSARNYDNKDGLQGYEFNPGAAFRSDKGELFFGGHSGYNSFYPERIRDNPYVPEVLITDLYIQNQEILPSRPGSPLLKPVFETDTLRLKYRQNTLSFSFAALNYTNPEKNEFRYILENFDADWTQSGNINFANYTNLPPGQYTFRVLASNNDGIWNPRGANLVIVIEQPFWETWWFYLAFLAAVLVAISSYVTLRTYQLRKTKMLLETKIRERTYQLEKEKMRVERASKAILTQKREIELQRDLLMEKNREIELAKNELDEKNEELTNINAHLEDIVRERTSKIWKINEELRRANEELDLFIYRASHDLKGPVSRLLGLSVLTRMDSGQANSPDYTGIIEKSATEMNRVIQKLTNIHHINKRNLHIQQIDLVSLIGKIKMQLAKFYAIEHLNLHLKLDSKQPFISDEILVDIILENLIENAFVFKKKQVADVTVNFAVQGDGMELSIRDEGLGIPPDMHQRIFDMFYRGSEQSRGSGLGLYLVKKAVEKLGGRIALQSEEGKYSIFVIHLPFPVYSAEAILSQDG
jgi:ligand-binding sensor domain-containing protein/signal transduction histidine kinase